MHKSPKCLITDSRCGLSEKNQRAAYLWLVAFFALKYLAISEFPKVQYPYLSAFFVNTAAFGQLGF
jgi:hypothetical protein